MRLFELQKMMGDLLLQPQGLQVLRDESAWQDYAGQHPVASIRKFSRARLYLYEELLFANVESTLNALYPFCRRHFQTQPWYELVERYRRTCPNRSYQLYRAAETFPAFLQANESIRREIPYLVELARYEWLEVELLNAPEPQYPEGLQAIFPMRPEDLQNQVPYLNPVSRLVQFHYPLTDLLAEFNAPGQEGLITPSALKAEAQPVDLLLYRDLQTLQVRFFKLNPLTTRLLNLAQTGLSYDRLFIKLQETAPGLDQLTLETIQMEGLTFLTQCQQEGILLGALPSR